MSRHGFWRGKSIDLLTREERDEVRAYAKRKEAEVFGADVPLSSVSIASLVPIELLRRLDQLDYFEATQYSLLGAADDRLPALLEPFRPGRL